MEERIEIDSSHFVGIYDMIDCAEQGRNYTLVIDHENEKYQLLDEQGNVWTERDF
jgi:hypothetical protein